MKKINGKTFLEYASDLLVLDGASGTAMSAHGLTGCPERFALTHPEALKTIQRGYIDAGSRAIYTYTFGGSALKLHKYGETDVYGINKALARLSVEIAANDAFVGGDIGPTGELMAPSGTLSHDEAYEVFFEQARALADGGADFIVIETMMDLIEARTAVLAAKAASALPVIASMSYAENGRTIMGASPSEAAVILEDAGADVIGANCSFGPDVMAGIIAQYAKVTRLPIAAKPNSGLPSLVGGKTVFSMESAEAATYAPSLIKAGATLVGGCCGTDAAYIRHLCENIRGVFPPARGNIGEYAAVTGKLVHPNDATAKILFYENEDALFDKLLDLDEDIVEIDFSGATKEQIIKNLAVVEQLKKILKTSDLTALKYYNGKAVKK